VTESAEELTLDIEALERAAAAAELLPPTPLDLERAPADLPPSSWLEKAWQHPLRRSPVRSNARRHCPALLPTRAGGTQLDTVRFDLRGPARPPMKVDFRRRGPTRPVADKVILTTLPTTMGCLKEVAKRCGEATPKKKKRLPALARPGAWTCAWAGGARARSSR